MRLQFLFTLMGGAQMTHILMHYPTIAHAQDDIYSAIASGKPFMAEANGETIIINSTQILAVHITEL